VSVTLQFVALLDHLMDCGAVKAKSACSAAESCCFCN